MCILFTLCLFHSFLGCKHLFRKRVEAPIKNGFSTQDEVSFLLRPFNTLTRKKEVLKPRDNGNVEMYTCGPSIYRNACTELQRWAYCCSQSAKSRPSSADNLPTPKKYEYQWRGRSESALRVRKSSLHQVYIAHFRALIQEHQSCWTIRL